MPHRNEAQTHLPPLCEDEVERRRLPSPSLPMPMSALPSPPRVEQLLDDICRAFCSEQEQQLREVAASLKRTAFQEVERLHREIRSLRHPPNSCGRTNSAASMIPIGSAQSLRGFGERPVSSLHSVSPRSPKAPPHTWAPPLDGLPQKSQIQHLQQLNQLQQHHRQLLSAQQAASPTSKEPCLANTLQRRPVADPTWNMLSYEASRLDDESVQVRPSGGRHSFRTTALEEKVNFELGPAFVKEDVRGVPEQTVLAGDKEVVIEVVHAHSAPSPRTFRPSREERIPHNAFALALSSTREAFEETLHSRFSRFYRKTPASNDDSSRGKNTLSRSSSSASFNLFQSASGMLGSVGSMFFAAPAPGFTSQEPEEAGRLPKTEAQRKAARRLKAVLGQGSRNGIISRARLARCLMGRMSIQEDAANTLVAAFIPEILDIHERLQSLHSKQPPSSRDNSRDNSHDNKPDHPGSVLDVNSTEKYIEVFGRSEQSKQSMSDGIQLDLLADIVSLPDPTAYTRRSMKKIVSDVIEALLTFTTEEAIDEATKSGVMELPWSPRKDAAQWEGRLNFFVSVVIFINLASAGISVDHWVGSIFWVYVETFCTSVMVAEALIKMFKWGIRGYFLGEQRYWNWLDLFITILGIVDVSFTILNHFVETRGVTDGPSLKITVAFRALRMARIVRTVKVVNNPFIKDLAKMVIGFVIGLPQLIWVMVMFSGILYLTGLFFRLTFGPESPTDRISDICPNGDDINLDSDPICDIATLYGEEFFHTVQVSMFTCFRFMLGDFGTRGGKNLVVSMSEHHGVWFNGLFGIWMIVVIFGVFNIISAIFVDATITGLKHNEVKKKYVEQYEKRFVREKLTYLMARIRLLCEAAAGTDSRECELTRSGSIGPGGDPILLYEAEFIDVMRDPYVKSYLEDLDIVMHNPADLFDTFDPQGRGRVTGPEMVEALIKLRGEPQKNDFVAAWLSLRGLHEKIDELRLSVNHHQLHLEVQTQQTQIWAEKSGSLPTM